MSSGFLSLVFKTCKTHPVTHAMHNEQHDARVPFSNGTMTRNKKCWVSETGIQENMLYVRDERFHVDKPFLGSLTEHETDRIARLRFSTRTNNGSLHETSNVVSNIKKHSGLTNQSCPMFPIARLLGGGTTYDILKN